MHYYYTLSPPPTPLLHAPGHGHDFTLYTTEYYILHSHAYTPYIAQFHISEFQNLYVKKAWQLTLNPVTT